MRLATWTQFPGLKLMWHRVGDTRSCLLGTQGLLALHGEGGFASIFRRSPCMLAVSTRPPPQAGSFSEEFS